MTTSFVLAVTGLVGLIGVLNLILIFGVIGRIRELQEVVQTGVFRDPELPAAGVVVGAFEVTTEDGQQLTETAVGGEAKLVCFFSPGCKPCADLCAQLVKQPPAVPLIAFVEGASDDPGVQQITENLRRLGPVAITRPGDPVMHAFKPAGFPTLIRTAKGRVAAAGHRLHQVL